MQRIWLPFPENTAKNTLSWSESSLERRFSYCLGYGPGTVRNFQVEERASRRSMDEQLNTKRQVPPCKISVTTPSARTGNIDSRITSSNQARKHDSKVWYGGQLDLWYCRSKGLRKNSAHHLFCWSTSSECTRGNPNYKSNLGRARQGVLL